MESNPIIDVCLHGEIYEVHYEVINNKSRNILTIRGTDRKIDITDEIREFIEKIEKKIKE